MKKVIILLGTILCVYFAVKIFSFIRYNVDTESVNFKFEEPLVIQKKNLTDNDYLELFDSIKIKNEFKDFEKQEKVKSTISETYILYDKNNKSKATMKIGITTTYVDKLVTELKTYAENINTKEMKKYLEKNNIKDDKKLFEFINNKSIKKINIFTKISDMKENYILKALKTNVLPSLNSITFITGDYDGYILNLNSDMKEIHIYYNDRIYYFLFMKLGYFTDDKIKDLLETVIIY